MKKFRILIISLFASSLLIGQTLELPGAAENRRHASHGSIGEKSDCPVL